MNRMALLVTLSAAVGIGCDDSPPASANETTESPQTEGPAAEPTLTDGTRAQVRAALGAYEQIRAKLVADDGNVADHARQLADAAAAAGEDAPQSLRPHLTGVATEARELANAPADDLDGLRTQYGEVSRHLVALLAAERSLAEGLHVFECGMTEGYGKWVQPSEEISNPYMGSRMPACGAPSSFQAT